MSNPEPNPQVEIWLKQGIDAARAGDQVTARAMLERVVEQDQRSEKGWFWLAAVVDDINEKKICLGNVLTINPDNERAQNLLQRLKTIEQDMQFSPSEQPASPEMATSARATILGKNGGDNRTIWVIAAGLGAIATLVLIVALVLMLGNDDKAEQDDSDSLPSGVGLNPTMSDSPSATPSTPSATITPTPSQTPPQPPATWTPVPITTPIPAGPPTLFPPGPATLGGKIIMRSGMVPSDPNNQPITIINPDGTNRQTISGTDRGHAPSLSPDGNRFVYIKYAVGTREYLLQLDNLQATAPQLGTDFWGRSAVLIDPDHPTWSPDGNFIAFTAKEGSATADLYRLSLLDPTDGNPEALQRLTQDDAIESWPAFSPDGRFIVYAADLGGDAAGTELRIYNLADGTSANLTTNGPNLVESAPDWSPDASRVVFQAIETGSTTADIYLIPAIGGAPQKIIDSDFDDIQPRFSPDGRYIVFSSNRSGNWDVYVFEIVTQTIYQVTTDTTTDIANDWSN